LPTADALTAGLGLFTVLICFVGVRVIASGSRIAVVKDLPFRLV